MLTAARRLTPPPSVWAACQALLCMLPCSNLKLDCTLVLDMVEVGPEVTTAGKRLFAKLFRLLLIVFDGAPVCMIIWMPAGFMQLSNGALLIGCSRFGNETADGLAKAAVEAHSVPEAFRATMLIHGALQTCALKCIVVAMLAAKSLPTEPRRDKESSRQMALAAGMRRGSARTQMACIARRVVFGGHMLVKEAIGDVEAKWRCACCRVWSVAAKCIWPEQCDGSLPARRATRSAELVTAGIVIGLGHRFALSGSGIWRTVCQPFL